uniref:Uncharacterized protein n=1 Tax=Arundo donax TaxID=35708 RepID=A0A0A8Y5P9_ARUDO
MISIHPSIVRLVFFSVGKMF